MKEGWEYKSLGDVCEILDSRRKPITKNKRESGIIPYYGATGLLDYVKDFIFDEKLVLLGEDGAKWGAGETSAYIIEGKSWVNNHAHVLTGKGCYSTEYIYMMFKNIKVSDVVTGVAQPKISQARLSAKKILIPERKLVLSYSEIIKPYMQKVLALQEQNEHLIEARDRLLPKLMSGEIEV